MTLYISKAFSSLNDEPAPALDAGYYDRITLSSLPGEIKLASGSQFTIEDIFVTLGANNYAPGQLEINFLEKSIFDNNVSKLSINYADPFEAIRSQSDILNAIGNGSIILPPGTSIQQLTQALLSSYPGYEAFPVKYSSELNGALPTGDVAYIYFRKSSTVASIPDSTTSRAMTTDFVDTLIGAASSKDTFNFSSAPAFGRENADHITNFVAQGKLSDKLAIGKSIFGISATKVSLKKVNSDKALEKAAASKSLFVYDKRDGGLYLNADGKVAGFGDTGGLFAILDNRPELVATNLQLL